ncbi:MAG: T9SS type A sorting domain-containing protein [Ignavibacteriales bacterium]|nr:T9SS type A sorting domain-containing protein [Ignavibacteriales bacterium]
MKIIFITIAILLTTLAAAQEIEKTTADWFPLPDVWNVHIDSGAYNVEALDLNKDGYKDVIVSNFFDTWVYYGESPYLQHTTVDMKYKGRMLAICDFNGDGYQDLIAMNYTNYDTIRKDWDGNIIFYWGSDTATIAIDTTYDYAIPIPVLYPQSTYFAYGFKSWGVRTGDLNNDGKDDIVISEYRTDFSELGRLYLYLGRDNPIDSADYIVEGITIQYVCYKRDYGKFFDIGDINGDGIDDLLISYSHRTPKPGSQDSLEVLDIYYGGSSFTFIENTPSKRYESQVNYSTKEAGWFVKTFSVDDINGDGIDDVVVGRGLIDPDPIRTTIHYGKVGGIDTIPSIIFTHDGEYGNCSGSESIQIGDYNDDGYKDFILNAGACFSVKLGGAKVSSTNKYGIRCFAVGSGDCKQAKSLEDVNNDGDEEFVTAGGYVYLFLGDKLVQPGIILEESKLIDYKLFQNYPNPFNPVTVISYQLPVVSDVRITLYNTLGQQRKVLLTEEKNTGNYEIEINANELMLSSGVYFVEMTANNFKDIIKISLIK